MNGLMMKRLIKFVLCISLWIPRTLGQAHLGCLDEDVNNLVFNTVSGVSNDTTAALCCIVCRNSGNSKCGLSETTNCHCSTQATITVVAGPCGGTCLADGSFCGLVSDPLKVDVYDSTGQGEGAAFTLTVNDAVDPADVMVVYKSVSEVFYIDFGDDTPMVTGTAASTGPVAGDFTKQFPYHLTVVPGSYKLTVVGNVPSTGSMYSEQVDLPIGAVASIDIVECPQISEPDVLYTCNVSVTYKNSSHSYTAQFDDDLSPITLQGVGNVVRKLGTKVPKDTSSDEDASSSSPLSVLKLFQHPIKTTSSLLALDYWTNSSNAITFEVMSPVCPIGTEYCISSQECLPECPYDLITGSYTCNVFYSLDEQCSNIPPPGVAPAWTTTGVYVDPGSPNTINKQHRLATPLLLEPGSALKVTGSLARSSNQVPRGDTVDDVATNWHHYVAMTVKDMVPLTLDHACTTVLQDVTLTVTDDIDVANVYGGPPAVTICERNITDLAVTVTQAVTDAFNSSLNVETPFYVRVGTLFDIVATFSIAGPIEFDLLFTPPNPGYPETTVQYLLDYPLASGPHSLILARQIDVGGVYELSVNAFNQHNTLPDEVTGLIAGPVTDNITIHALYPISLDWVLDAQGDMQVPGFFFIPRDVPQIIFEDPSGAPFSIGATVFIDWGDGGPLEESPFVDPGDGKPRFGHAYPQGGVLSIKATIKNAISEVVDINFTIALIEEIKDFAVTPMFFPTPTSGPSFGIGTDKNQFPMDKNISFFMSMTKGAVETYVLKFTNNNSVIQEYLVANMFLPTEDYYDYHFPYETLLHLTVEARNKFETVSVDLIVETLGGLLRGLQVDDYSAVVSKGEEKTFLVSCDTVGGKSCIVVDFGDGSDYVSFGNREACMRNFSHAVYDPTIPLTTKVNISHVYRENAMYNITVIGFNGISIASDMLMFPVTDMNCGPPILTLPGQNVDYLSSPKLFRGEDNAFLAIGQLDCDISTSTSKQWEINHVDEDTGMIATAIPIMNIIESWNRPELMIPASFLPYGYFRLIYTLTILPDKETHPQGFDPFIFQKQIEHYIMIVKTPLVASMLPTSVTRVARGPDQSILLEPAVYTVDPDYPDVKNYTIKWLCKTVGETFPDPVPEIDILQPPIPTGTGCYGNGPGYLKVGTRHFEPNGSEFRKTGETYTIIAEVTKDTRMGQIALDIAVSDTNVPILDLSCTASSLCRPSPDGFGVYVNPNNRMGLTVKCLFYCDEILTYDWKILQSDDTDQPLDILTSMPIGSNTSEFSLSTEFFDANPTLKEFRAEIRVTNMANPPATGFSTYFMKVNQRPIGGTCTIDKIEGYVLLDEFNIICSKWRDPEDIGIESYIVQVLRDPDPPMVLVEVRHTSEPRIIIPLILGMGDHSIMITILDKWGAVTDYYLTESVMVKMITKEQFDDFDILRRIDKLIGEGDIAKLPMIATAVDKIISQAEWFNIITPNCTDVDVDCNKLVENRTLDINTINKKLIGGMKETMNFLTLGSAEAASGSISAIMNTVSSSPNNALTIDLITRGDIYDLLDSMTDTVGEMPISAPLQLRRMVENIGTISAGIVVGVEEITSGEEADRVPPMDMLYADEMYYDTDIGYDLDMTIPETEDSAMRFNIKDTTYKNTELQMPRLEGILNRLSTYVLDKQVVGELMDVETENNMTLYMGLFPNLYDAPHYIGLARVEFPYLFCPQGNCSKPVGLSAREWPTVTYRLSKYKDYLNGGSRILDLDTYDRDINYLEVKDSGDLIHLTLHRTFNKRDNQTGTSPEYVNATYESMYQSIPVMYTQFVIDREGTGANIEVTPLGPTSKMFIMVMKSRLPTIRNHTYYRLLDSFPPKRSGLLDWTLPSESLNGTGTYFVGIGQYKGTVAHFRARDPVRYKGSFDWLQNVTTDYKIRVYTTGCYYYDNVDKNWTSTGLTVLTADYIEATCHTNHLTPFGSGMFVLPNTIDFSYVFANMAFTDNLTIYLTLILCLCVFIFLLIWARWKDRKDVEALGAAPLPDNLAEDKYLYEILVFTGNKKEAQTDSTVQFVLFGDHDQTEVRTLADDRKRKILRKAGIDVFVMAVPKPLGPLNYLRIWHDNSGRGPNASWFLSYIVFRDIQTGQKFQFICNQWLALECNDGQIERVLPLAGRNERGSFRHLFHNSSNKSLSDGHLWFSVFMRPPRSRFTRCQRVASCFSVLFLSMLVNAMWYNTIPSQPTTGGLSIGPFSLSPEQIAVGFISNLIVFPPSFLIIFLFRKSRPRVLRKSRIEEALKRASQKTANHNSDEETDDANGSDDQESSRPTHKQRRTTKNQTTSDNANRRMKRRKRKFSLPWWCTYLAWILVLVCVATAMFFLLLYGVMFGNEKATNWVSSLVISFFSSLLFVQPLKVFLTAMFLSMLCKSVNLDEDDADEDEERAELQKDELWLYDGVPSKRLGYSGLNPELLEEMRRRRLKEIEMWSILMELAVYLVYIWILVILSYGQRDPNAYYLQKNFRNSFIHEGAIDGTDFTKITNVDMLWFYLHNGFLGDLRADVMYNGKAPYQLRGFLNDYTNRIMGYATIRQVRVKKNSCQLHKMVANATHQCSSYSSLVFEESRHYCRQWKIPNTVTHNTSDCKVPEFRYESAGQLKSLPYWGMMDWYGGGGYVIHLRGPTKGLIKKFTYLQENYWIDSMARAILIEFSTYNSQVNLFGICTLLAEITPGGGVKPYYRFDAIRLIQHHDNFGAFIIFCEVAFVLFTLYFTVYEFRLLYKLKKRYFDSYWAYAELTLIFVSYGLIILYFMREYETRKSLKVFKHTYGNGYVKMTYAATMDEFYGYMLAFLVFVGAIKFIKLLRFNKRVGVLSATLHQCWDDLSGFLMAFAICFFSFVLMFYFLLSPFIRGFSNFIVALETSFSMMMGKFQFNEMKEVHPLVPVMFFVFVLCTSWVLINLFLTLIIKSFEKVKDDLNKHPNEYEMIDFIFTQFKSLLGMSTMSKKPTHSPTVLPQDPEDQEQHHRDVEDLPGKVDKFLEHINTMYFGGSLDVKSKGFLQDSLIPSKRKIIGGDMDQGVEFNPEYKKGVFKEGATGY